tara:strand:+ start:270 stop:755 length:486 start_codon:yes stop_codon:yes gene_type:complete
MLKSFTLNRLVRVWLMIGLCYLIAACDSGRPALTSTGEVMDLSAPEDGFLLLNYWADWCLPCKEEIPELNELHREAKDHGLAVFGVSFDALVGGALEEQVEKMEIEFPVLIEDPRQIFGYGEPEVLPMTVLIDSEGTISKILIGPQTLDGILAELKTLRSY